MPLHLIFALFLFFTLPQLYCQNKISFKGEVSFTSNAPLEVIKAESNKLLGVIDLNTGEFAFSVKLKTFQGFNSALQQEHFHENYMQTTLYPTLTYTGKLLDKIDWGRTGEFEIRTKGKFYINGVLSERILKHKVKIVNNRLGLISEFKILLSEHNIHIPKIVNKKIAEEIQINISANQISQ